MMGSFEQVVLLAVVRLGDRAYGMAIRDEIVDRTERSISLGAVYATLDRLSTKGYLSASAGPGGKLRRGRPRKFFSLEAPGRRALEGSLAALERMISGVPRSALKTELG